ncbi:MAG: metal-dependent hydrolase [Gemmatimonadetes bacterium]|nr:metal-dependent hydrolase [Gemmatimonadota bacterium]MYA65231.1 metal-dependent hydrolase [Gemmatimonadota bacterium]MYC00273.1 metal-dependent hydrolase [Gemmatimonadota bacterium]MYH52429.1 metal-dependent hydrolase [Gemmatimonadota bacterium]MYK65338.1 metal-dependent hydrolase [Gemmatimonadota bacterium]
MARLTFHGQSTFTIETDDGTRLVIDPFFDDNPVSDIRRSEVGAVDYILCTHGHFDHFVDAIPLARETGATLISTFEIVSFAETQEVQGHPLHIGGGHDFPFGRAKMTPAIHGGQVHGDATGQFTTVPGGFLLHIDGKRIYHAGDTALTLDMQLLRGKVDVAILPIGDNFTMGPEDAATAVGFIEPAVVIPMHYNTWPLIEQDPEHFRALVGDRAHVQVMSPGDVYAP